MKCPFSFIVEPQDSKIYHRLRFGSVDQVVRGVVVPCGKCTICKQNRASEWGARLVHELQYHKQSCFITLTYDDENIPETPTGLYTLVKKDYQDFLKRLRKNIDVKIKYFLCGEYGSVTARPHYHAIIFGWRPSLDELIPLNGGYFGHVMLERLWSKGFVQVGSVSSDSIHYTTGYILKNQYNNETLLDRERPFNASSNGLGLQYAIEHADSIKKANVTAEGRTAAVPRYYIKKLGGVDSLYVKKQKAKKDHAFMRRLLKRNEISDLSVEDMDTLRDSVERSRQQGLKDLEASRARIRGSKCPI